MLRVYDGERLNVLRLSSTFKSEWIRHSFPFRDFLIFPYCLITIMRHGSHSRLAGYYLDSGIWVYSFYLLFHALLPNRMASRPSAAARRARIDQICRRAAEETEWINTTPHVPPVFSDNFTVCGDGQTLSVVTSKPPACNLHEAACISSPPHSLSLAAYKFVLEWKWNIIIQAY